jgi:hypothetical protein
MVPGSASALPSSNSHIFYICMPATGLPVCRQLQPPVAKMSVSLVMLYITTSCLAILSEHSLAW